MWSKLALTPVCITEVGNREIADSTVAQMTFPLVERVGVTGKTGDCYSFEGCGGQVASTPSPGAQTIVSEVRGKEVITETGKTGCTMSGGTMTRGEDRILITLTGGCVPSNSTVYSNAFQFL